jgi:hypothetical protein
LNVSEFIESLEKFVRDHPATLDYEVVVRGLTGDWITADLFSLAFGRLYIEEAIGQPYDCNVDISADDLRQAMPELRKH